MATQRSMQRAAGLRRDAGLEVLGRATRWVAVGSIAAVGMFSVLAAKGLPGHGTATTSSTTPAAGSGTASVPSGAQTSQGSSIQTPTQAPTVTQAPPAVSSGGS